MRMRRVACLEIEHPGIIIVATAVARVRVDVGYGMVRRRRVWVGVAGATATSVREDVVAVGPEHGGDRIFGIHLLLCPLKDESRTCLEKGRERHLKREKRTKVVELLVKAVEHREDEALVGDGLVDVT
jgi:hypothetical protein